MPAKVLKPKPKKPAKQALAVSEAELRAMFASMQDVVLVIDREGMYRKIAPTNAALLVKPPEELLGKNLRDIFPAEQAETFLSAVRQVLETQQSARIEYELLINERPTWFATSISPMDEDNTVWVARDITERKQAEAALRESEERYHSLFDRIMDGIYRSTHAGRFVDINPAMVRMFGYASKEEMLNVDIKNELYFTPDERGSHVLDTGKEEIEIYRMRRKDGSAIWVEDHGTYVHDEQGRVIYHEGMLRDITERKRAEDSLETAHRELQQSLEREQHLARTDGLTGLYNYRHFFELASHEFSAALRYQRLLAVLMFDTDNLKQVNDTLGHSAGDRMLALVAQTAAAQVRAADVLARYGGDEFVVLLPQTSAQQALPIAERIRTSVAAAHMETEKGPLAVTLSIGIAEIRREPEDENVERIVRRADQAMYAAKQAGRNRIVTFGLDETGAVR
jgi:diguanylate cyclase (GGDEF)-like protein/PAS domain S-box-containing protein